MPASTKYNRNSAILHACGVVLCGIGISFAIVLIVFSRSEEILQKERSVVAESIDEMRLDLEALEVPQEQVAALLRIHSAAESDAAANRHYLVIGLFVFSFIVVALVGFNMVLWGRLRTANKPEQAIAS